MSRNSESHILTCIHTPHTHAQTRSRNLRYSGTAMRRDSETHTQTHIYAHARTAKINEIAVHSGLKLHELDAFSS